MAIREDVQAAETICNTNCKAYSRTGDRAVKQANQREGAVILTYDGFLILHMAIREDIPAAEAMCN